MVKSIEQKGFGFMRRYTSYLSRHRWYAVGIVTLAAAIMLTTFTIGLIVRCNSLVVKLEEATARYEKLEAEYIAYQAEHETSLKPREGITYSRQYVIQTFYVASAVVSLGKGEVFEARMSVVKADRDKPILPPLEGSIVFWIYDPHWRKVVDAGRIEGEYEFAFPVEESGNYMLVFQDTEGYRIIYFEYNSPSPLQDASVRP